MCGRPGHFAKNCPKKERAAKLLEQAQIHSDDTPFSNVESLFLLDDDYSPQALVVMLIPHQKKTQTQTIMMP